jgi:hypothetical protein
MAVARKCFRGSRGEEGVIRLLIEAVRGIQSRRPRVLDCDEGIHQEVLNSLESSNWAAKLPSGAGVLDRVVQRSLTAAERVKSKKDGKFTLIELAVCLKWKPMQAFMRNDQLL